MKLKKLTIAAAVLGLTACIGMGSLHVFAQTEPVGSAVLCVTGTASVEADADLCVFGGSIEAFGDDMQAAEKACGERLHGVREAFAPFGTVREESAGTYPSCSGGYTATRYLTFTVTKAAEADAARTALAKAGITCMDCARYLCSDEADYKLKALEQAIDCARKKAAALGTEGELIRVEEQGCYPCPRNGSDPQKVTYTATVRAVFAKRRHAESEQRLRRSDEPEKRAETEN